MNDKRHHPPPPPPPPPPPQPAAKEASRKKPWSKPTIRGSDGVIDIGTGTYLDPNLEGPLYRRVS